MYDMSVSFMACYLSQGYIALYGLLNDYRVHVIPCLLQTIHRSSQHVDCPLMDLDTQLCRILCAMHAPIEGELADLRIANSLLSSML